MTAIHDLIVERLDRESSREEDWSGLVVAAVEGDRALHDLLATPTSSAVARKQPKPAASGPAKPAFLRSITVQGFRGIGPPATLEIPPGPGLTLVVGRNGSGKSSFAEALELLLTGDTFRWAQRTNVWREGWRNLHQPHASIAAEFSLEGERGPCTVAHEWAANDDLEDGETRAQVHGKPRTTLDALGWEDALVTYRPFLSYNELGSMLDEGPSKLYDALAAILGLEELAEAQKRLQEARTAREKELKQGRAIRDQLLAGFAQMDDERAEAVAAALGRDDWGLEAIADLLAGASAEPGEEGVLRTLRELAALPAPSTDAVATAAAALREAAAKVRQAAGTVAARSRDLADVLDRALHFHERHGDGDCPVCGRSAAMDKAWHVKKAREAKELRDAARDVDAAQRQLADARSQAQRLPAPRPEVLAKATTVGLSADKVREVSQAWTAALASDDPDAFADRLTQAGPPLLATVEQLRAAATRELEKREDAWRPLARQLTSWLPVARAGLQGMTAIGELKKAEQWLKHTAEEIRDERFDPIAHRSIEIWNQLRLQSNVSLGRITLERSGKQRRVDLHVQVDGVDGAALGVMSQGELHCLALSLFIPRATLPESPFRFIVIDDPVQSMDPARVDGLARVLESAARDRQVIVFTHDDRLPEAVRRLNIAATVREVTRRESSRVEVAKSRNPVDRHVDDAFAVAKTQGLPDAAARRVIPGLCRMAIEAACMEAVRRRRLGRGERHDQVEGALTACSGTNALVALALFDDAERAGDVLPRLNKDSKENADLLAALNKGAHGLLDGGLRMELIRRSEKLAHWLQGLK